MSSLRWLPTLLLVGCGADALRPLGGACDDNDGCEDGLLCVDSICVRPCTSSPQCGARMLCVEGLCEPAGDPDVCAGITCSGHGVCEAVGGAPSCRCDAPYVSEGVACVEEASEPACEGEAHLDVETDACVPDTRTVSCPTPPTHAHANTATELTQTWDGASWQPALTLTHDTVGSTNECRFACDETYSWSGTACEQSYVAHASARCHSDTGDQSDGDWYWVDSNGELSDVRQDCEPVARGIACADDEGCCSPAGVAINGDCVTYAPVGAYCYASPQCQSPLVCSTEHVCE